MKDPRSFLFIQFNAHRNHHPLAFTGAISWDFIIHMQTVQAFWTMVATAPLLVLSHLLFAVLADKAFVVVDHVFTYMHNFGAEVR